MEAALLWARREGYPLPDKPWPRWILLIGIFGLFAALIPGLAVIGICWWKEENYKKAQDQLLARAQANSEASLGKYTPGSQPSIEESLFVKNYVY